ncbi:hypothetical protein PABG_07279 [Paracoccidioides brasiliensis Pb03]|nr:hypothetical protein PABG_07279 [Paracoccidioides brasiliensis Pb03]
MLIKLSVPPHPIPAQQIKLDIEPDYKAQQLSVTLLLRQVSRIKERVEEKEGIPPVQQRLIYGGKQMYVLGCDPGITTIINFFPANSPTPALPFCRWDFFPLKYPICMVWGWDVPIKRRLLTTSLLISFFLSSRQGRR